MKHYLLALMTVFLLVAVAPGRCPAQEMAPEKVALYTKYYELKSHGEEGQKQAYEVAKEFVQKFGTDNDEYVKAVKTFIAKYERLSREVNFYKAYNAKDYPKTFELGRQILNEDPDNFFILSNLVRAGYFNAYNGHTELNGDAIVFTKHAIELVETNKITKPDPFASLDDAHGFLYHAAGLFQLGKSPLEAMNALIKASQFGSMKNDPANYYYLGQAIFTGEYDPLETEYKAKFAGQTETPESKVMFDKLIAIGNRAVDAYARAVALSTKPESEKFKTKVLAELTDIYKGLHQNSDAGLSELIATVLSKPLPQ